MTGNSSIAVHLDEVRSAIGKVEALSVVTTEFMKRRQGA
jgi:hypothetical protein